MTVYKHGDTVRMLVGTPSQRQELWLVDLSDEPDGDWGQARLTVARSSDPDSLVMLHRDFLRPSSVLDLMVTNLDDSS